MTESRDGGAQCHGECHDSARDRRGEARDQDLKHRHKSEHAAYWVVIKENQKEGETGFRKKLKFQIKLDQSQILSMHNSIRNIRQVM